MNETNYLKEAVEYITKEIGTRNIGWQVPREQITEQWEAAVSADSTTLERQEAYKCLSEMLCSFIRKGYIIHFSQSVCKSFLKTPYIPQCAFYTDENQYKVSVNIYHNEECRPECPRFVVEFMLRKQDE
jgi:hypothetical protein